MAKQNITYLLGAGASANKMPTIATMAEKIKHLNSHLSGGTLPPQRIELQPIFELLKLVEDESRRFNTVDTYARKLFLNGRIDDVNKLKAALSICFIYWQLYDGRGPTYTPSPNIDHRYISLISSFLQKKKNGYLYIPENIKFITWNYDMQIELALKYFTEFKSKSVTFDAIQNIYDSVPNVNNVSTPSIVHLNGIAGMYSAPDGQVMNAADIVADKYSDFQKFVSVFSQYYSSFFNELHQEHLNYFSYSWEKNPVSTYIIQSAINIMKETDILVIIGYSFPVFNREIDRKLFSSSRKFKVYYQDPNADKTAFSNIFDIPIDKIYEEKKVDQFLLPHEY